MNQETPDINPGFRKGRETRDQIANICKSSKKKKKKFQKNIYFCFLATLEPFTLEPFTVWITKTCGQFLKKWKYQTTIPTSWETWMQVKKQQLELDMEQWTGSTLRKE